MLCFLQLNIRPTNLCRWVMCCYYMLQYLLMHCVVSWAAWNGRWASSWTELAFSWKKFRTRLELDKNSVVRKSDFLQQRGPLLHTSIWTMYYNYYILFCIASLQCFDAVGWAAGRVVGCWLVVCLERGADLHMAQLMPLSVTHCLLLQ